MAATLRALKRFDEATEAALTARKSSGGSHWIYRRLGDHWIDRSEAAYEAKRHDQARAFARKAIELCPDVSHFHNALGNACFGLKEYEQAAAAYRQALRLNDVNETAMANLAGAFWKLGRKDEALTWAREARDLDMESHWVFDRVSVELLEEALRRARAGDEKSARAQIARAEEFLVRKAPPLTALGRVHIALKEYDRAREVLEEATRLAPDEAQGFNELGTGYYWLKRYASAEMAYRRATDLLPDDPVLHTNLAGALLKQEKESEAREAAREALRQGYRGNHWVFPALGLEKESAPK